MSKLPARIKTLDELKARKFQLQKEILVAQNNAKDSVGPAKSKLGAYLISKATPVAAVGVGLFLAFKLLGGKEDNPVNESPLASLKAERRARAGDHYEQQKAAKPSAGFVSIIRGFLPFIKVMLPLAQSAFARYQASRATDIAKTASAQANSATETASEAVAATN